VNNSFSFEATTVEQQLYWEVQATENKPTQTTTKESQVGASLKSWGQRGQGKEAFLKHKRTQGMVLKSINRNDSEMKKQINKYQSRKGSEAL